jgi:hypothetical protein
MAEQTDDDKYFSSLDPLGSSFGEINRPTNDIMGLSPFEGQRPMGLPEINFPIIPVAPSYSGLTNKQNFVRETVVGRPPKKLSTKNLSAKEIGNALHAKVHASIDANQDKNEYVKLFAYDATANGGNFYKRYSAFGDETVHKLGFHPLLDNEAIYNEHTTGWQQSKRMLVHSFWPLMKLGFGSGWESTTKMFKGDFSANTEDAKAFEEAAAIGYDSRGGAMSFVNNTMLNFGYTAGIITEALVEEVAALGIEAVSLGAATPAVAASTANNLRKVGQAFRGLDHIDDAADAMKAVNTSLKAMNRVDNARKFFNTAKIGNAAKSFGRFLNPLENITDAARTIIKNEDNLTGMARAAFAAKRGFGGFYGDVKAINMALSEARLEAGIQQNHMYDDLYRKQYIDNGNKAPTDEQQKSIIQTAKDAGSASLVWNTGLIFASNKIVLDNIVGGKGRGPLSFMKSKTEDLLNLEGGKVLKTRGARTLSTGKKFKTTNLQWRKSNLWNTVKGFAEQPLRKGISGGINYFKRNITEALQENAQEAISEATKNYYVAAYSDPNVATNQFARGLTMDAIGQQFSRQGFETFASGFTMGMLSSPLNNLASAFSIGYNKIFNKEEYAKYKAARQSAGENFVKHMSSIPIEEFFDNNVFDYGSQSNVHETRMAGSEKDARDAADAAFVFKMGSVIDNNMTSLYTEQLENLSELTADEIEEVVPSIPKGEGQKYLDRIPAILDKISKVENRYKAANERFPNPININDLDKDDPDYEDAFLLHRSWQIAKQNAVFMGESFDDTMSRMSSIMNDLTANGPIRKGSYNNIKVLFDQGLLKNELDILTTEIETLEASKGDPEQIRKAKRKKEALEELNGSLSKFRNYYSVNERERIKEEISKRNPDLTPEQVNKLVEDALGVRTEEGDAENTRVFKEAYSKYIRAIGNIEGESVFDSAIDDSFEKLKDYYLLDNESKRLAEYVNLLHDPKGFYDHVQRNKKWMRELYDNRAEYYENLKEQEFQKKEANDLLNWLAGQNMYISFDDLEKFLTAGILPEEIYDDTNKKVIKKSNPKYNELIEPFLMLRDLQSKKSEAEIIQESVKGQLQELERVKAERIAALPVEERRKDLGSIDFNKSDSVTFNRILKQLQSGQYAEAVTTKDDQYIFYKDGDVLKYDNANGEIVTEENLGRVLFKTVNAFELVSEPDPVEVKKIEDEFNARKAEIIANALNKGVEDPEGTEPKVFTADTPLDQMPPDLYNILATEFAEQYIQDNGEMNLSEDDFHAQLESFVKSDFIAARIIDDYNRDQEIERATQVSTGVKPDIRIIINDTPVSLEELDEADIRGFLRTYEAELKALENKTEELTPEETTRVAKLKYNINGIKKYLQEQVKAGYSVEQRATIDKLEKLVKEQNDIVKTPGGYVKNGQLFNRVTNVIKEFLPEYEYRDKLAVEATFRTTIEEQGFTVDSIKNFINQLRKQKLGGFSEFTYTELEKDLIDQLGQSFAEAVKATSTNITFNQGPNGAIYVQTDKGTRYLDITYTDFNKVVEQLSSDQIKKYKEHLREEIGKTSEKLEKESKIKSYQGSNVTRNAILKTEKELKDTLAALETAPTAGLQIATDLSPAAKSRLKKLGFTEEMLSRMSKEDIEAAKTFTSIEDAKELVDKYSKGAGISNEQLLERILSLVSEKTFQASRDTGNYMDDQMRNLLDNVDPVFDNKLITREAFDEAFSTDEDNPGYLRKIKDIIDKEGLYILSRVRLNDGTERGFVVYDEAAGIAGEIDLLAVDRFGNLHIIDIKTGKSSKWAGFNNIEKGYSKKDNYTLQQQAYSNLLYNMLGMDSTISLLPIQLEYNDETGQITKVERPTAKDLLKPGLYRIPLTASEEIKANIESKIPRKVTAEEAEIGAPINVPGEDFEMAPEEVEEGLPEPEVTAGSPIENFKRVVKEATQEQLDVFKSDLSIAIEKNLINATDVAAIQEAISERERELDSGEPVKLTASNLPKGTLLIANQSIFTGKAGSDLFVEENADVIVSSVNAEKETVTLKSVSNGKQKTVSLSELNKMFILKQTVMAFEEEETDQAPLTKVEKNFVNDSIDNVNELLRNNERKEALRKEANSETLDAIDTELFEDTTSDC